MVFLEKEYSIAFIALISIILLILVYYLLQKWRIYSLSYQFKLYEGSCHCKKVTFQVNAPKHLVYWDCNCSVCFMKKNYHFIVPSKNFQLCPSSSSYITEYRFNTNVARHMFCKVCGVQSYYHPRSNPDGIAITLACINQQQIISCERKVFDGINWELYINKSKIQKYSKAE